MSTIKFNHLHLLAIFSTVVDAGSFAAAARKLMSSRSRISEQVAALESDLGVRLLQRSTRQLTITDEGKQVYEQAIKLSAILQKVESITTPAVPSGRVTITMPHDIAHRFVLPALAGFRKRYPEIQLDMMPNDTRLNLIGEQIDLAIRIGIPKDESLIARVMHEERIGVFASPSYLKQVGGVKTLKSLEKCHWILFSQLQHSSVQHMRHNNKLVEIKPKSFYRCDSPLLIQQMVIQGLGVGSMIPNTVEQEVKEGRLVQLMPSLTSEPMVFALVYPSRHQVPPRTRALIDYLLETKIFS